jgi:hypothetical protein
MTGRTVGSCHIPDKPGEGGMAAVYKALDTRPGREISLKFLPACRRPSKSAAIQIPGAR